MRRLASKEGQGIRSVRLSGIDRNDGQWVSGEGSNAILVAEHVHSLSRGGDFRLSVHVIFGPRHDDVGGESIIGIERRGSHVWRREALKNRRSPEESRCNTARDGNVDSRECRTKTRPVENTKSSGPLSWFWRSVRGETRLDDLSDELLERGVQTSASLRSERYKLSDRNVVNFVVACIFRVVGDVCSEARYGGKLRVTCSIRVHNSGVDDVGQSIHSVGDVAADGVSLCEVGSDGVGLAGTVGSMSRFIEDLQPKALR